MTKNGGQKSRDTIPLSNMQLKLQVNKFWIWHIQFTGGDFFNDYRMEQYLYNNFPQNFYFIFGHKNQFAGKNAPVIKNFLFWNILRF
jgi:hypothetical protein